MATNFKPRYTVYPHGIGKNEKGAICAIFRMVLSIEPAPDRQDKLFTFTDWNNLIAATAIKWQCRKDGDTLFFEKAGNTSVAVSFGKRCADGTVAFGKAPGLAQMPDFGKLYLSKNKEPKPCWDFLNKKGYAFIFNDATPAPDITDVTINHMVPVLTHEKEKELDTVTSNYTTDRAEQVNKNPIAAMLTSANTYAKKVDEEINSRRQDVRTQYSNKGETLQYNAIWAQILDEPEVAALMGVTRDIYVEMGVLNIAGEYNYNISCDGVVKGGYLLKEKNKKYYNSVSKFFLDADKPKDNPAYNNGTFLSAGVEFYDPYKGYEKGNKNIDKDGIYVIVELKNAFLNDINILGFNVVASYTPQQTKEKEYASLSIHQKKIYLQGKASDSSVPAFKTSGSLTAGAELLTDGTPYRSNILFAWRGDNLLLNRENKVEEPEGAQTSKMLINDEYCDEALFVNKELFKVHQHLIPETQSMLLSGRIYDLHIRPVSPCGYHIPLKEELLPDEDDYILTVQDLLTRDNALIGGVNFDLGDVTQLPLKSSTLVGEKEYKDNTGDTVDNKGHIVLNKIEKERSEVRYIYPPQIKLEDFKHLGYMQPERISNNKKISGDEYADRCIALEDKFLKKIPDRGKKAIEYLPDPRVKGVYICAADLFTSTTALARIMLPQFNISNEWPYFSKLSAIELAIKHGKSNYMQINGDTTIDDLADGIYNLRVYSIDDKFLQATDKKKELLKYNFSPLKISIVNTPKEPKHYVAENTTLIANRTIVQGERNYWNQVIILPESYNTWRSVKYIEETTVFRQKSTDLKNLLQQYKKQHPDDQRELMIREYPYEMFLVTEGSVKNTEGLKTDMWPECVTIDVKLFEDTIEWLSKEHVTEVFRLKLNDKQTISGIIDGKKISLQMNGTQVLIDGKPVVATAIKIEVLYDRHDNKFFLEVNGNTKHKVSLEQPISPEISANDLVMPENVLLALIHDTNSHIGFNRSAEYIIVSDLGDQYYRHKKIKLFASSIFQSYFPSKQYEYPLGTEFLPPVNIEIRNNAVPKEVEIKAELLLMYTVDDKWKDEGAKNIKHSTTQHIVQLQLPEDFMDEGHNKLGILISKRDAGQILRGPFAQGSFTDDTSEIGEDVTKLTNADWSGRGLNDLLDLDTEHDVLKKYITDIKDPYKFYTIGNSLYEILELTPFYSDTLKTWHAVLPFRMFGTAESMFVKFKCVKLCPGHGLIRPDKDKPNSFENPYSDSTGTNISVFSKATELPLSTHKRITVERMKGRYDITINKLSEHKDKVYSVMVFHNDPEHVVFNVTQENQKTNDNLVDFTSPQCSGNGTVLLFNTRVSILFKSKAHSIVVYEFEKHSNILPEHDVSDIRFVAFNPLFDVKGLTLINAAEFIL